MAADDPSRVVTVDAQSGKTGKQVSISYTSCKVVGNGSFGVVFAAKMLGQSLFNLVRGVSTDWPARKNDDGSEEPEQDIAIKTVLQDKRFKVGSARELRNGLG